MCCDIYVDLIFTMAVVQLEPLLAFNCEISEIRRSRMVFIVLTLWNYYGLIIFLEKNNMHVQQN